MQPIHAVRDYIIAVSTVIQKTLLISVTVNWQLFLQFEFQQKVQLFEPKLENNRINDGVEAERRKSLASFQII